MPSRSALGAMSWERGHLARNGPKARKAPTGATPPSRPPPRPRRPMPSRPALGAMFLGARASCPQRAEGPQSADRSDTPEDGPRTLEKPESDPPARGAQCSWERGHLARNGPKLLPRRRRPMPLRSALGAMFLGARASCPHRAEGPQSADRSDTPEPAPPAGGAQCRRAAYSPGRRPLGHVAGLWPACGRDARAPRGWPCERCPWERGHLARNGPKARKAPTEATRPSRPPPRPRRPMPSRSALGALPRTGTGGARERGRRPLAHVAGLWPACGRDARAPRGWPCERCPGSAGILPAPGRRPAKRRQERHARAGHPPARGAQCRRGPALGALPRTGAGEARERGRRPLGHVAGLWPACGRDARAPRVWPCERCSWERGHLARIGPKARKAPTGATRPSRLPPARGAQCRRGRPWVHCRGRALEKPASVGVARLPMWRACGPLAGGTPALPGCGPVSDVPGSAGIWPAPGRRPAKRRQERHAHPSRLLPRPRRPMPSRPALGALPRTGTGGARERGRRPLGHVAGLWPACGRDARAPRVWPCERCSWERGHLARNGPKARKVPTGATPPSRPPPRRRRPMPSRSALGAMSWERGHLARIGPKARKAPTGATRPSRPPPRRRRPMPSRSALGALPRTGTGVAGLWPACGREPASVGPHRAEGPQSADRSDTPEPALPSSRPLAHVAGLRPACGRDARAPRDGARAQLADSAPQGHSKLSARWLMGPCREHVHGLRQGTSLWARHLLLPRRARIRLRFDHPRQSDESWCSSPRVTSRWLGDRLFERPRPIRMHLHSRAVERHHLHSHPNEVRTLQLRKHSVRHTGLRPAIHPRVDGVPAPEGRRQSTPLALLFGHVQDGIEHREMTERDIAALLGEQVRDVRSKCVCVSSIAWNPLHRLWVRQPIGYCVNTP